MATIEIASTIPNVQPRAGVSGNLIITTDIPFTTPPDDVDLVLRVVGLTPDKHFYINGFTWVEIDEGVWDGTYTFAYTDLTPTSPLTFTVDGLKSSLVGDVEGTFTIQASADYSVGGTDEVTLTLNGNTDDLVATPPYITFDNGLTVGVSSAALTVLQNNSGSDVTVSSITVPVSFNDEVEIYYNNSGEWALWVEGVSTFDITNGSSDKVKVLLTPTIEYDYASYSNHYLEVTHLIGSIETVSQWSFAPGSSSNDIQTVAGDVTVDVQSFTWLDGETKTVTGDCPDDTDLGIISDCSESTAVIEVLITNVTESTCPETGTGEIRLGDVINGWYTNIVQNIDVTDISFPEATVDDDYVLAKDESLTVTLTVNCPTVDGEHTLLFNAVKKACMGGADDTVTTFANSTNIAQAADLVPVTDTAGFLAATLADTIQGTDTATIVNGSINYIWSDVSLNDNFTVNSFKIPETGDYTFYVQYVIPVVGTSTVREYALFVNGTFNQVLFGSVYADTGDVEVTLSLTKDDTVQFGVYHDASESNVIAESFVVSMRYQEAADIPQPETACSFELSWTKATSNLVPSSTSVSVEATKNVTKTIPLIIDNEGTETETIESVTIDAALSNAGLTLWFPEEVSIVVALSHTFNFVFHGTSEGTYTGNVSFAKSYGNSLVIPFTIAVDEELASCTIAPTETQYNIDVDLNVAETFRDTVNFNTNSDSGTLEVIKGGSCDALTFGENPLGTSLLFKSYVSPGQVIPVPITINVTGLCPESQIVTCPMNWVLKDYSTSDGMVLCFGTFNVRYTVSCPTESVCPISVQNTILDAYSLTSLATGELTTRLLLDRDPDQIGDFTVTFTLPSGESVVSFATQDVVAGLTWDDSGVGSDPSVLLLSVDSTTFTGSYVDLKVEYTIPASPTQSVIYSSLTISYVFDSAAFTCTQDDVGIGLGVTITSTTGGYETKCVLQELLACNLLTIVDDSNYGADANHDMLDFTLYRKVTVTLPSGVDYVLSTHGDNDEVIQAAYSNVLSFEKSIVEGGVYKVTLESVPTYTNAGTYNANDCVVKGDATSVTMYKSLQNLNSGVIPGSTPGWEDWWEDVETPTSSYSDIQYYVQKCDIESCKKNLQRNVWCETKSICYTDPCDSVCMKALLKYEVLEALLIESESLQLYSRMSIYYDAMKLLCDCTNDCQ